MFVSAAPADSVSSYERFPSTSMPEISASPSSVTPSPEDHIARSSEHDDSAGDGATRAYAQIAGGWFGACAGHEIGAQVGAVVGAVVGTVAAPGFGTLAGEAVGGTLGGLAGTLGGAFAGSRLAEAAAESVLH